MIRTLLALVAVLVVAGCGGGPSDEQDREFGLALASVIVAEREGSAEGLDPDAAERLAGMVREHGCDTGEGDASYREIAEGAADRLENTPGAEDDAADLRDALDATAPC